MKTQDDFVQKYGNLIKNINGMEMIELDNVRTILHNEIMEGNMKALEFLKFVNEKFPKNN